MAQERIVRMTREDGVEVSRVAIDCPCGTPILCAHFTNPRKCGKDYNFSGQLLAPRECWGEETGESASDIMLSDS